MYGHIDPDRLDLLAAGFAVAGRSKDGRPTLNEWAHGANVTRVMLFKSYGSRRSMDAVKRIVQFAAQARGVDAERLEGWLCGGPADTELEDLLGLEARKFRCKGSGPHLHSDADLPDGWFDVGADAHRLIVSMGRCKRCARIEAGPEETAAWEERLLRDKHKLSQKLQHAIAVIQAAGRCPTAKGLARVAEIPYEDVRKELFRAGLEKPRAGRLRPLPTKYRLIWLVLGLRLLSSSAEAAPAIQTSQSSLWGATKRRRRLLAFFCWLLALDPAKRRRALAYLNAYAGRQVPASPRSVRTFRPSSMSRARRTPRAHFSPAGPSPDPGPAGGFLYRKPLSAEVAHG